MLRVSLSKNIVNLGLRYAAALPVEYLSQSLFSDESCVFDIEVVEGKPQVLHCERLLLIDSHSKEFAIVDCAFLVEVNRLKDCF